MDDATGRIYSAFFVAQDGTWIDNSFGFERHYIRGKAPMTARAGLAVAVMIALGVGHIKAGRPEKMRSLVSGCYTGAG